MGDEGKRSLGKVSAWAVVHFWLIKVAATTLAETGVDAVSVSMGLGYLASAAVFAGLFWLAIAAQTRVHGYHAGLHWTTLVVSAGAGTTVSDLANRWLGIGYLAGSVLLVGVTLAWLTRGSRSLGRVSDATLRSPRGTVYYWVSVMLAQALGTAASDWVAQIAGLGYRGGALVFGGVLVVVAALLAWTSVSRSVLFWAALVVTRPLGVVLADLMGAPAAAGGMALSRFAAAALLLALLVLLVARARPETGSGSGLVRA